MDGYILIHGVRRFSMRLHSKLIGMSVENGEK